MFNTVRHCYNNNNHMIHNIITSACPYSTYRVILWTLKTRIIYFNEFIRIILNHTISLWHYYIFHHNIYDSSHIILLYLYRSSKMFSLVFYYYYIFFFFILPDNYGWLKILEKLDHPLVSFFLWYTKVD